MLFFLFLDVFCVIAASILSLIPYEKCCEAKRCIEVKSSPLEMEAFQILSLVYAVLKMITLIFTMRLIFRRKRKNKLARDQQRGIREHLAYCLRLAIPALILPVANICLVYYVTHVFPTKTKGFSCKIDGLPHPWWLVAGMYAFISIKFFVEVCLFVFCPNKYMQGRRFAIGGRSPSGRGSRSGSRDNRDDAASSVVGKSSISKSTK